MAKIGSRGYRKSALATQVADTEGCNIEFLKFAPEIRNQIYDAVFVKPTYIGAASSHHGVRTKSFYKDASLWRNLGFAMTCRQVYEESSNIFYAKNGFEFYYIRPFLEFLEAIGVHRRGLLTKLKYHQSENSQPFIVCRYLKSCTGLKELEIWLRLKPRDDSRVYSNAWWEYPLKDPRNFFSGNKSKIEFGEPRLLAKRPLPVAAPRIQRSGPIPYLLGSRRRSLIRAFKSFADSLEKIKNEEKGTYKRRDLPNVFQDQKRCAWSHLDNQRKVKKQHAKPKGLKLTNMKFLDRGVSAQITTGSFQENIRSAAHLKKNHEVLQGDSGDGDTELSTMEEEFLVPKG